MNGTIVERALLMAAPRSARGPRSAGPLRLWRIERRTEDVLSSEPMTMVPYLLGLLLLATSCAIPSGTSGSTDASDKGTRIVLHVDGAPPRVVRPPVRREAVQVTQAQYEEAMVRLALQVRAELPRLPAQRLEVISLGSPEQKDERAELVRNYLQWCAKRGTPGDCRGLLKGRLYLTDEAKRDLAFALASAGVWAGTAAVIGEVLDPVQLELAVMTSLVTTMVMLSLPEPISKAVVVTLTLCMVAYVGWDTVVDLISGWKRMAQEASLARTFAELMDAGERYGRVMERKSPSCSSCWRQRPWARPEEQLWAGRTCRPSPRPHGWQRLRAASCCPPWGRPVRSR